jgi:hypothetical protein
MDMPEDDGRCSALSRRLLELNASDLVHGSYGIAEGAVVLTEALELSHLDYEEFRASYEGMTLALAEHLKELAAYREPTHSDQHPDAPRGGSGGRSTLHQASTPSREAR